MTTLHIVILLLLLLSFLLLLLLCLFVCLFITIAFVLQWFPGSWQWELSFPVPEYIACNPTSIFIHLTDAQA